MDDLADGKTLFIGNVSSWDAANQLWNCFASYGEVVDMYRLDNHNGEARRLLHVSNSPPKTMQKL